MSYHSWHTYGYGICVDDIAKRDVERLQRLLDMAPKYREEIQTWLNYCEIENPTWDDYMDFDQDYCLGLASILQAVILEAEKIELTACDNFEGGKYLVYSPKYPWELKWRDRWMTKRRLEKILLKYICVLDDAPVEIDYQSVENGG